jgi:hypothetical protein
MDIDHPISDLVLAERQLVDAHEHCFIANSVKTEIAVADV